MRIILVELELTEGQIETIMQLACDESDSASEDGRHTDATNWDALWHELWAFLHGDREE